MRRLPRRPSSDDRLDAELRDHVERYVADLTARGLSEVEARRRAHLDFGGLEQVKEACRDVRPLRWLHEYLRDVRLGFRALSRDRFFAASVVAILALGIGTTVMMFSILRVVVLRPLPYADPHQLVQVRSHLMAQNRPDGSSMANIIDWRNQSGTFAGMTFYRRTVVTTVTYAGLDAPRRAQEGLVGPEFFDLLGTPALAGRTFSHHEFARRDRVVVLSEGLWHERFAGEASAIGRTLWIDGHDHTVLGVMPRSFQLPTRDTKFWRPFSLVSSWPRTMTVRDGDQFEVLGRLKPGVTIEQADADMRLIAGRLRDMHESNANLDIRLVSLFEHVVGSRTRRGLWLGFAAVLCLLVIASANAGGLIVARMARRRAELALRAALGAGRVRLLRQLLAEATGIWAVASAAGVLLAYALLRIFVAYGPRTLPRLEQVAVDAVAIAVSLLAGFVVVMVCGTAPAWAVGRSGPVSSFGARDRSSRPGGRLQDVLVAAQIAGTIVLLVGAALFARSFMRAQQESPGYPAENLLIVRLELPRSIYTDAPRVNAFFREARRRLEPMPGVVGVGGITDFFIRRNADQWVTIKGRPGGREEGSPRLAVEGVTPGFFNASGIAVLEGRDFDEQDYRADAAPVVIVNQSLARRFWPGESALGKQMVRGERPPADGRWQTVIGVVADMRREGRDVAPVLGAFTPSIPRTMDMIVRARTNVNDLVAPVRRELRAADSALPVPDVSTAGSRLAERLDGRRFESQALAAFSAIALLLSAAGLYALLAYQVTVRTREIGIRSALGADRGSIVRLILGKGLRLALTGSTAGTLMALSGARLVQSLLYETSALHPASYAGAGAALVAVAIVAAGIPALRAGRISPVTALRQE